MNTLLSIIVFGAIPATVIILAVLFPDWSEQAKFWIESGALYLSALALYYAERAARKSKETEDQLIRYGLSSAENKTEFGAIFKEHLVDQLGQFKNSGGGNIPAFIHACLWVCCGRFWQIC